MNEKADLGLKVPKKGTTKIDKMRKCPKTANFDDDVDFSPNHKAFLGKMCPYQKVRYEMD